MATAGYSETPLIKKLGLKEGQKIWLFHPPDDYFRLSSGCGFMVIWVSWNKKSSGVATDLTEDVIRGYALSNGLVDIKVCAVSELWSGLKLVVPLKNR
jgi:hypothetical protein